MKYHENFSLEKNVGTAYGDTMAPFCQKPHYLLTEKYLCFYFSLEIIRLGIPRGELKKQMRYQKGSSTN